jgi:hypothetical protein
MTLRRLAVTASVLCMTFGAAACNQAADPKAKVAVDAPATTAAAKPKAAAPAKKPAPKATPSKQPAERSARGQERAKQQPAEKLTARSLTAKAVDAANEKGTARIKLATKNAQLEKFEGSVRFGTKDFARRSDVVSQGSEVAMVLQPKAIYMKVPGMTDDAKKPWVDVAGLSASKDSTDQATAAMLAWMRQSIDPTAQLAGLQYGKIIKSTNADVEGAATTKHQIEVKLSDLAKLKSGAHAAYQQLASRGVTKLIYELYVDDDFLPHRLVVPVLSDGDPLDFVYYDWGASLDLGAPPASQIGKLPNG